MGIRIDELWWELDVRSQKLNEGVDRAEQRLKKFVGFVKAHPIAVLGALAAAFALTGAAAAKFAMQIDRHLQRVDALIPKTTQGVDRMRNRLLALAETTTVPLEDLAAGLEQVVATGEKNPDRAFIKLTNAAKLAQAAGTDLSSAIGTLDNIMDSFGIATEHSADVLDVLMTAAQHGTPLAELTPVLSQVGAQARAAGVGLDQVVAAINALTEGRGVTPKQAIGAIREAFGDLGDATEGTGRQQAMLGIHLTVVKGKLQLAGQGAADFNETLQDMANRSGRADIMLGQMTRSAVDQAAIVQNQLKVAWVQFGEEAAPLLLKLTQAASGFLETVSGEAGVRRTAEQLRELAGGWRDVNQDLTLSAGSYAHVAKQAEMGWTRIKNAITALKDEWGDLGFVAEEFGKSVNKMPAEDLQPLQRALMNLTADQREQLGVTEGQLAQMVRIVNTQVAAVKQAQAAAGGKGGATGGQPPVSPETLQKQMQLRAEMAARLAALTTGIADDLQAQLDAMLAKIDQLPEHLRSEFMAGITRLRGEVSSARTFDQLGKDLDAIEERVKRITDAFGEVPATLGLEMLPALQQMLADLQAAQDKTDKGSALWQKYKEQIQRIVELTGKLVKNIGNAAEGQADVNAELDKTLDRLELQASRIQNAVRGALQLGQAFGLIDDSASQALQSITQIATAVPQVSAVLKSGGDLTKALPGILSIAGGVASLLGSIFGPDPEEEHRKQVLRDNTEALRKLTDRIGELGQVDVTGSQFGQVQSFLAQLQQQTGFMTGTTGLLRQGRVLGQQVHLEAQLGISAQQLKDFAAALGITFANLQPTIQELRQLNEALAQTQLTQFSQTFAGQIELLSREFELFDISDPIDQLERLRQVAMGFADSPLIDALFGGLDLETEAGRAALEKRIRDLYAQLQAGTITPAQLGGLTPQQLLDLLSQLESTMDQVAQGQEQGQTAQFQVSREITETTAGRLVSIGVTSMTWLEEIASNTLAIADRLGANAGALLPPSAAELAAYNPGSITIDQLIIQVSIPGATSAADAERLGDAAGVAAAAAFDRQLGATVRKRALLQGSVIRN